MKQTVKRKEKKCETVPERDIVSILGKLTHECFSLKGIMQTIGENFVAETDQLTEQLCPEYSEEAKQQSLLFYKIVNSLPSELEGLKDLMHDLDDAYTSHALINMNIYMVVGIAFGMKIKGASLDEIAKACKVLEIV